MAFGDLVEIVFSSLVVLTVLAELTLGAFVLSKSDGRPAERFLGAFLMLHALLFGLDGLIQLLGLWDETLSHRYYTTSWNSAALFLPVLLVGFAGTYPSSLPMLREWRGWALWLLLSPAAIIALGFGELLYYDRYYGSGLLQVALFALFIAGTALSAMVLFVRARRASTRLESRRIRYMLRVLVIPLAVGSLILGVFGLVFLTADWTQLPWYFFIPVILVGIVFIFVPPVGMAYGLLRYRVFDLDLRLRFTVKSTVVGSVFLSVFLAAAKLGELVLQNTAQGSTIGIVAMGLLFLVLHPVQRLADRVARRLFPARVDSDKYREFRRWETYRATFEDVSADGNVTQRERRVLDSLAKSLRLSAPDIRTIEREVRRERRGAAPG